MSGTGKVNNESLEDSWMIRPCEMYKDEHYECTCLMGRLNQYYVFGKLLDCDKWWQDYKSCISYRKTNSTDDARNIIEHETQRRLERLKAAQDNDVWEYRRRPPADWSSPLPDWVNRDRTDNTSKVNQEQQQSSSR